MSKQDIATVVLYLALTTVFLVQAVSHMSAGDPVGTLVYGALGVANAFVTFFKYFKFVDAKQS